ncbi:hypothetical protein [Streptomyces sp. NPDC058855]|uniref:hypothetical protein n=1 Tax=Streptomyces sp. NPDC058855 TaxID=3346651 RepID=UPI0036AE4902
MGGPGRCVRLVVLLHVLGGGLVVLVRVRGPGRHVLFLLLVLFLLVLVLGVLQLVLLVQLKGVWLPWVLSSRSSV